MFLPKVITFSGLDGAGKSTVISSLKVKLESEGLTVKIFTMYDDLSFYVFLRLLRDYTRKLFGKKTELPKMAETDPNYDLHAESWIYKIVRSKLLKTIVLPIDTLSIYLIVLLRSKGNEVVLMDRTSYDYILDILPEKYLKIHMSILLLFSFKPFLSVFIDTPAQVSFDRKGEFTVEYLNWRGAAYIQVFNKLDDMIVVDNHNNSVEDNTNALLEKFNGLQKL